MGPRAGLEGAENLAATGIRSPDRSESLYRLSYPAQDRNASVFDSRYFCHMVIANPSLVSVLVTSFKRAVPIFPTVSCELAMARRGQ